MPVLDDAGSRRGVVAAPFNPNQMNGLRPVMHLSAVRIADP